MGQPEFDPTALSFKSLKRPVAKPVRRVPVPGSSASSASSASSGTSPATQGTTPTHKVLHWDGPSFGFNSKPAPSPTSSPWKTSQTPQAAPIPDIASLKIKKSPQAKKPIVVKPAPFKPPPAAIPIPTINPSLTASAPAPAADAPAAHTPPADIKREPDVHSKPKYKQVINSSPKRVGRPSKRLNPEQLKRLLESSCSETVDEELTDAQIENARLPGLKPLLLPHQVRGVKFMASREKSRKYCKGGILADEMGLGKTIQSIGCMLSNMPSNKSSAKQTLVLVPTALMQQWKDEINKMAPSLKVMIYYKTEKIGASEFKNYDVVITTYNTVSYDKGSIRDYIWYRIICDEAHSFRNPLTQIAKAMMSLNATYRWALTGTPIHNVIDDMYTLVNFIGVESVKPPPKGQNVSEEALELLKTCLKTVMLRRTQKVLKNSLPQLIKVPHLIEFTDDEYITYQKYEGNTKASIVKCRQACCGVPQVFEEAVKIAGLDTSDLDDSSDEDKPSKKSSMLDYDDGKEDDMMAKMLGSLSLKSETKSNVYPGHTNTKFNVVKDILNKDRTRRTVLFCSFVTPLELLTHMLKNEGIEYALYTGGLSNDQRKQVLADFADPKCSTTVLLCSLHASAVGLNLTSASQVIMFDPWWNPQIVNQAVKRVHRIGQKDIVHFHELAVRDTIEERILYIQARKAELAKNMLEGAEELSAEEKHFLRYG